MNSKRGLYGSFGNLLRRGAALALASAMSLSLLPATAWAATPSESTSTGTNASEPSIGATQVTDQSEFPKIELQLNIVRTEYGTLNGTAELSLRAGPSGETDAAGNTVTSVSFHTLATNLRFNAELLTPIDWEWVADLSNPNADLGNSKIDLEKDAAGNKFDEYYQVAIPAKKDDLLPTTGAIAQCGIVDSSKATGMTTNVANGTEAMLFFKAEAYNQPITLDEMTTLAVIRFKVNNSLMEHLSITPSDTKNADGTYTYTLHSDLLTGDDTVTNMATLNTAVKNASDLSLTNFETVVGFAYDTDIANADPARASALYYSTGASKNEYYYVPDAMTTDKVGTTAAGLAVDKKEVTINKIKYELPYPNTVNTDAMILAVDSTKADGDPAKYSYTSNLIPAANISFTVVSEMSYADQGVDLDKYSVLVFVDWDNTLLGTLVVPKYENVTSLVNEYVKDNLIHPQLKNNTNYSSTARLDTYRGKYIATEPSAENVKDDTVVADGADYPLTNKLDYAFLRRPMERATTTDDSGNTVNTAENTWVQKTADNGTAYYDTKYPYAYGWAKCTADNYTEIWTTLGTTGELNSWDKGDGTTTVASVTSTDSAFQIADLETGLGEKESTVFLKAIYEPGDSLLSEGFQYRLCTNPSYNKLNTNAASAGGAYSVFAQLERATVYEADSTLRGVTRVREPYIRQETTADLRWVENTDKGIENDLPNASQSTAEAKTETTYTKVDSANSEVIDISLTLSARQNKVDYFLTDGYNNNFVTGGERSATNFNRSDSTYTKDNYLKFGQGTANFVVDNYNYYVAGESEERDPDKKFYDVVQFKNINGSHGFVLYGTLNQLMEQATKYYNGKITSTEFNSYLKSALLSDMNLKKNAAGDEFTAMDLLSTVPNILKNLAGEVQTNHEDDSDYWDDRLKCARLTYHQIQWYIIEGHLYSPEDADDKTLSFCHLHSDCAATNTDRLDSWDDIIDAASSADTATQDKIKQLTAAEVEEHTHLRDKNGNAFTTSSDLKEALVRAIKSLSLSGSDATWENIQYAIMHPAYSAVDGGAGAVYPSSTETATYWWYDGATSAASTWEELMTALSHKENGVAYPDGKTHNPTAKLDRLETAFDAGFNSNAWVKATHNLAIKYDETTDTPSLEGAFAALKTKLTAAYSALKNDLNNNEQHDWKLLQFYLLNDRAPDTTNADDTAELESYWWYDGNFKVKDIDSLMRAAANPDGEAWQSFTFADLYTQPGLQLRKSFAGEKYTEAEFAAFKQKVLEYLAVTDRTDHWEHLQFYLMYGRLPEGDELDFDSLYYWWKDNGSQPTFDLTTSQTKPADRADALAKSLSTAMFRAIYNGCAEELKTALSIGDVLTSGRLVAANNDTTFDALTKITDMDAFLSTLKTAYQNKLTTESFTVEPISGKIPALTWEEIQAALLGGSLPSEEDGGAWWKTEDSRPVEMRDPYYDFRDLAILVRNVAAASAANRAEPIAALQAFLTEDVAKNIGLVKTDGTYYTKSELDGINWNVTYTSGRGGIGSYKSGVLTLTWYQVQWAAHQSVTSSGKLLAATASKNNVISNFNAALIPTASWIDGVAVDANAIFGDTSDPVPSALLAVTLIPVESTTTTEEIDNIEELIMDSGDIPMGDGRTRRIVVCSTRNKTTGITTTVTTVIIKDAEGNVLSEDVGEPIITIDSAVYKVDNDTDLITPDAGDGNNDTYDVDRDTTVITPDQGNNANGNEVYDEEKDTVVIVPDAGNGNNNNNSTNEPDNNADNSNGTNDGDSNSDKNTDNGNSGSNGNDSYENNKDTVVIPAQPESSDNAYENENDTTLVVTSLRNEDESENNVQTNNEQTNTQATMESAPSAVASYALNSSTNTTVSTVTTSVTDQTSRQATSETTTVTPTDTTDAARTVKDFSGYEIVIVTETPPPVAIAPTLSEPSGVRHCEAPTAPWQSHVPLLENATDQTAHLSPLYPFGYELSLSGKATKGQPMTREVTAQAVTGGETVEHSFPIARHCETPTAPWQSHVPLLENVTEQSPTQKSPQTGGDTMTPRSQQRNNGSPTRPLTVSSETPQTQEITAKGGKAL